MDKKKKPMSTTKTKPQGRTGVAKTVYLPPDLLAEIEEYRQNQDAPPSMTAVIIAGLRLYLASKKPRSPSKEAP